MTEQEWEVEMGHALRWFRARHVNDPDLLADALTWYWYFRARKGCAYGSLTMRWALSNARMGTQLPGLSKRGGYRDALPSSRRAENLPLRGRRFLPPAYHAQIQEEVALVKTQARNHGERLGIKAVMTGQTWPEASQASGLSAFWIGEAFRQLRRRCRARR